MRKINFLSILAVLVITIIMSLGNTSFASATQDPIIMRFGHSVNEDHDWHKGLEAFKEDLEERTNGKIQVQIFPNEALGAELDVITSIQQGTAEGIISGESMSAWVPEANAIALPYAVSSLEGLKEMAESPEIGGVIEKEIIDKINIRPIGYFVRSARNLTCDRKIESIDDLEGVKIRVPNNELSLKLWNAFGATATPLAAGEIFSALQTGLLNGQENPHANNIARSLWEVQDYYMLTEHVFGYIYVLIGEDFYQSLTPDLQEAVIESGKVMTEFQHDYLVDALSEQEELLRSKMEFVEVDKAPFKEIAKQVVKEVLDPEVYELYEKAVALDL